MDPSDFNATSTLDNDNTSIISRERNNYRRCLLATTFIALLGLTNILLLFLSITIRLQGIHTGISLLTITSPILRFLSIECHKGDKWNRHTNSYQPKISADLAAASSSASLGSLTP